MRRVLLDGERNLAAEGGNAERPVNKEERTAGVAGSLDVAEHEPRRQAETAHRLEPFHHNAGGKEMESRPRPLDDHVLVFAAD